MQDYYKILNVSKNSSDDEIKKSYLKLIKKYHPDVYAGDKVFAEKQTALITEAYTTLKNKDLRMKYDRKTFGQNINAKETTNNSQTKTAKQSNSQTKPPKENEQTRTQQANKKTQKKEKQKNTDLTDEQKQAKNQKIILDLAIISLLLLLFLLLFFPLK